MRISHTVVGTTVEWQNPRTGRWEIVTSWSNTEEAIKAKDFYNKQAYSGW